MELKTEVVGLEEFARRFRDGEKIVTEELANAGNKSGLTVERFAKKYVRKWRHHLERSITTKTTIQPLLVSTSIGTNLPYAKAEEFGRPADSPMPPPGALLPWMTAKGIAPSGEFEGRIGSRGDLRDAASTARGNGKYYPVEYLIARAIKRKAPDPHPFLGKAYREQIPNIRKEFQQVPKRVIARLKRGA